MTKQNNDNKSTTKNDGNNTKNVVSMKDQYLPH